MTSVTESLFGGRFPNLGECRNCFVDCGACPKQIASVLDKADHNLANLEACIERRETLEIALRSCWDYMLARGRDEFKPFVQSQRERLGL